VLVYVDKCPHTVELCGFEDETVCT